MWKKRPKKKCLTSWPRTEKKRSGQVDAVIMLDNKDLVLSFHKLGTNGRFLAKSLESSLAKVLKDNDMAKDFKLEVTMYCKAVCSKIIDILAHSRYVVARRDKLQSQIPVDREKEFETFCKDLAKTKQIEKGREETIITKFNLLWFCLFFYLWFIISYIWPII